MKGHVRDEEGSTSGKEAALPMGERVSQDSSENGACAASIESKAPAAQRELLPRNSSPMFPNVSSDSLASSRNICNTASAVLADGSSDVIDWLGNCNGERADDSSIFTWTGRWTVGEPEEDRSWTQRGRHDVAPSRTREPVVTLT